MTASASGYPTTEISPGIHWIKGVLNETGHAYILQGLAGNYLLGVSRDLTGNPLIKKFMPYQILCIGDRHHGKSTAGQLCKQVGRGITCSEIESVKLGKGVTVEQALPMARTSLFEDFIALPTPGHTPGALSYIFTQANHVTLFMGDSLCPVNGIWRYWVSHSNLPKFAHSIEFLDGNYDLMVGNSFACSPLPFVKSQSLIREILDGIVLTARSSKRKQH